MLNRKLDSIQAVREPASAAVPGISLGILLRQLCGVVEALNDQQYCTKPVGVVESSVGAHVRHCLDHVLALLGSVDAGNLDYDDRRRGTDIETSRHAAIEMIRNLEAAATRIAADALDVPLRLSVRLACGQSPLVVGSTVGRELAFVISHTIHHNALVAAMVKTLGGNVPERFGYAPATVEHLQGHSCAR
jgi:uncharacterized damage-inducible protein DinB